MITLFMNESDLEWIELKVQQKEFPNRSEGLRHIIKFYRDLEKTGVVPDKKE